MTQCNKQFDPLKPCRTLGGEKIIKIEKYSDASILKAYSSETTCRVYHLCGHTRNHHQEMPTDLINVEEESENCDEILKSACREFVSVLSNFSSLENSIKRLKEIIGYEKHWDYNA